MASGVYIIEHQASGRLYVGSAINIEKRWAVHLRDLKACKHHSRHLSCAWVKHGREAFTFRVALLCDQRNLLMYEQALLDFYRPAFNTNPTAGSMLGFRHCPESRARMSASNDRRGNPGYAHSEESKRRISLAKTGVLQDPEVVARRKATIARMPIPPKRRKFSVDQIREVRCLLNHGVRQIDIADHYRVGNSVISEINTGKTYGWAK